MLRKETTFGMTYGQLIATIGLLFTMLIAGLSLSARIAKIESHVAQNVIDITELRKNDIVLRAEIEARRIENRDDHILILKKVDDSKKEIIDILRQFR